MSDPISDLHPAADLPADQLQEFIKPEETEAQLERRQIVDTRDILNWQPMTVPEITFCLEELNAAFERYATVSPSLIQKEYDAERAYIETKARARLEAPEGGYDRDRAAWAELQAMDALKAWHTAKTLRKAADSLYDALKNKAFGLMNQNKVAHQNQIMSGMTRHG